MRTQNKNLLPAFLALIGSPEFDADTTLFEGIDHAVIITDKENEICGQCPKFAECTAQMELYIPALGRFIFDRPYTGNMDVLISLLSSVADVLQEHRALEQQSENHEFYRQLVKKVIDLNPHAVSALDKDGSIVYQNIIAQNEPWPDDQNKNAVSFQIHTGAKTLGHIQFVKSHTFSAQSALSTNTNRDMAFHHILGTDPAITNCIDVAKQVSATNSTILILGESGTGKEIFANAIHKSSQRNNEAFVAVNCAAIPENLLESELFGYVDGAFTGAKRGGKTGKIAAADRGTLFLDEIGDLPLSLQAKLLRVLQDRKVEPIGSLKSTNVDVRIICATNKNIESLVSERLFREDLYYRINVIPIHIPPLRTRKKDIRILLAHNIKKYCILSDKSFKSLHTRLFDQLAEYEWKGNVRELENVVEYAITMCNGDTITADHLPIYLKKALSNIKHEEELPQRPPSNNIPKMLEQIYKQPAFEKDDSMASLIEKYGFSTEGKKKIAAELNISLATLYRRIKKMKEIEAQR